MMAVGAGGIYSSAEDLCRFQRAITRQDGKGLVSSEAVRALEPKEYLKGVWVTDGEDNVFGFGLGWDNVNGFPFNRYNIRALSKGGDSNSYHSQVVSLPDLGLNISVVSSGGGSDSDLAFANYALLEVLKEKNIINDILPDVQWTSEKSQVTPAYLTKYNGIYAYSI